MSQHNIDRRFPLYTVRFGIGKEIQLYPDELVVTGQEEEQGICLQLQELKRLTLTPGDPNPAKLVLTADLHDDTTIILAEGMSNARDFRAMLPHILVRCPQLELEPADMAEQLRQALNSRRAWTLTCYGACLLVCVVLYVLYLIVSHFAGHH